ncbi:family 16 glycosylhydrolase [Thalassotalea sp. PLHSN55]|uniref:family 16 glycosylhydrolase n=1 Tax=Thalassotalea sp. PLHSN55 TaxID=3435888 RepID=UPI003F86B917
MNYKCAILLTSTLVVACKSPINNSTEQNDWLQVELPTSLQERGAWQLIEDNSDSFSYTGKTAEFYRKWHDKHLRGWLGPGATYFSAEHSDVVEGKLVLSASPVPADKQGKVKDYGKLKSSKKVFTGFVTGKKAIQYPVFIEAKLKISHLALANNFWMLSDDDRNEIDITETYGNTKKLASQMSSNYHIFKRDPVTNNMLGDYGHVQNHHQTENKDIFNQSYHRFGVYWHSPTYMEFYLDGKQVRILSKEDDLNDLEGLFFDRAMRVIFDMEDHVWRAAKGLTPAKAELNNASMNKMYIDWIRAYKPI